jgi:hypothetical protein
MKVARYVGLYVVVDVVISGLPAVHNRQFFMTLLQVYPVVGM